MGRVFNSLSHALSGMAFLFEPSFNLYIILVNAYHARMIKPVKREPIPREHLINFNLERKIEPIIGTGKTHRIKRTWILKWKGEVIAEDLRTQRDALELIREKVMT